MAAALMYEVFGTSADYFSALYGKNIPDWLNFVGREVVIVDFSFSAKTASDLMRIISEAERVIWIDHHESSFRGLSKLLCPDRDIVHVITTPIYEDIVFAVPGIRGGKTLTVCLDTSACGSMLVAKRYEAKLDENKARLLNEVDAYDRWQKTEISDFVHGDWD